MLLCLVLSASVHGAVKNKGVFIIYPVKVDDGPVTVYKVYENGDTKMIMQIQSDGLPEAAGGGERFPMASPDNRHIAYCEGEAVLVRDAEEGSPRKIFVSRGSSSGLINGWSRDGKKLLYHIVEMAADESGEYDNQPAGRPVGKAEEGIKPGYYIYDTGSGASVPAGIKGKFICWGLGYDMVCQFPEESPGELVNIDISGTLKPLFKYRGKGKSELNQISLDSASSKAVAVAGTAGQTSGVILIDFLKVTSVGVTGSGPWGRFLLPGISPDGTKISWMEGDYDRKERSYIYSTFVVNGKIVFKTRDYLDEYKWISNSAVAIVTRSDENVNSTDELYVINAETGKISGMTPLK